ncbi:MAG: VCBS repeat-containing protein [Candidatus Kerfeldbacteria bacterium]|nr:VCBS repeat-containing protein [Candidatus Kerfeldbacteria bacterium]
MKTQRSLSLVFGSLLTVGFSLAFATSASAATLYFNFGGSNSTQNGQESTPYVTVAQFTNVVAGDTVYVTGTLSATLGMSSLVGTAANPTRVMLWPGRSRLAVTTSSGSGVDISDTRYLELSGIDASGSVHGIFVHRATGTSSNITLSSLSTKSTSTGSALQVSDTSTISISSVTSTDSSGNGISIDSGNSNVSVSSVTITNPTSVGIGTTGISGGVTTMTIDSATVTGAGSVGIQCTNNSTGFTVTNSTVTGSGDVTNGRQDINIQDCDGTVIRGNIARNATGAGIRANSSDTVTIDRNISSGHTGSNNTGIAVAASNNVTVTNNVVYGNTIGLFVQATAVTMTGTTFSHNTIYNNSSTGVSYVETSGGVITDMTFRHNIVYTATDARVNGFNGNGPTWNSSSNYNLYYLNGSSAKMETSYTTLADWQAAQGMDANSSTGDPLFTTTTSGSENLTLQDTSPAIDAAVGSTLTTDYTGATRPYGASGRNDIGAYENTTFIRSTSVSMAAAAAVSDAGVHTITLTITDSTNPSTTTYAITTDSGTTWLTAAGGTSTTPAYSTSKTWTHTSLSAATSYSYYFRIADSDQTTYLALSSAVSATTLPAAPTDVTATGTSPTTILVSWAAPDGEMTSYTVSSGTSESADDSTVTDIEETSTTLSGLTPGTLYYVKVRAHSAEGASIYSDTAQVTTPAALPDSFTSPSAADETLALDEATVSWATVPTALGYRVSYGTDVSASNIDVIELDEEGAVTAQTADSTISLTLTDLTPGITYYWKVATLSSIGYGDYSTPLSFTTSSHSSIGLLLTPGGRASTNLRIVDSEGNQLLNMFTFWPIRVQTDVMTGDVDNDGWLDIAAGAIDVWSGADIRFFDRNGAYMNHVQPFGAAYRGGVEYTLADVNGDRDMELIAIPRTGSSNLRVYNLNTTENVWELLDWTFVFGPRFKGGSSIAAGDTNGDGRAEIAIHPRKGSSNVQLYRVNTDNELEKVTWLQPYSSTYRGGISMLLTDYDGDSKAELVTIPLAGASQLRIYNVNNDEATIVVDQLVYAANVRGAFNLASGDVNGDGTQDIAVVPQAGNGSSLKVYKYDTTLGLRLHGEKMVFDSAHRAGTNLTVHDIDQDGMAEVIVGSAYGRPNTRIYDFTTSTATLQKWFWAFQSTFSGGVMVSH